MHEHLIASFSLREKVPVEPAPYLIQGRMRVWRSGDVEECFKVQHSAIAVTLRRTLTPTPLPMGEGL